MLFLTLSLFLSLFVFLLFLALIAALFLSPLFFHCSFDLLLCKKASQITFYYLLIIRHTQYVTISLQQTTRSTLPAAAPSAWATTTPRATWTAGSSPAGTGPSCRSPLTWYVSFSYSIVVDVVVLGRRSLLDGAAHVGAPGHPEQTSEGVAHPGKQPWRA